MTRIPSVFILFLGIVGCQKVPAPAPGTTIRLPSTQQEIQKLQGRQDKLLAELRTGKQDDRVQALSELAGVVKSIAAYRGNVYPEPLVEMVEAMGDPNPVIRQAAATACSRFPRLLPMTVAELKQQEVFLPAGKEPVGVLINILGSRDPSLRKAAAVALGSLGPKAKAASAALKKAWELACTAGTDVLISPRSSHLGGTFAENQAVARAIAEARRKIDPIGTAEDEAAEQLKHAMKFEEGPQKENLLREIMQKYPRTSAAAWAEAMRKK